MEYGLQQLSFPGRTTGVCPTGNGYANAVPAAWSRPDHGDTNAHSNTATSAASRAGDRYVNAQSGT